MKKKQLYKGIAIMLFSSTLTCTGQLLWKLSALVQEFAVLYMLAGFLLYGLGAVCMILALRFGDLSVLHPMLGAGYVLSIVLGYAVLGEPIYVKKVVGIAIILFGLVWVSRSDKEDV